MTEISLTAEFGPEYNVIIRDDIVAVNNGFNLTLEESTPIRLSVGTAYNATSGTVADVQTVKVTMTEDVGAYRAVSYDGLKVDANTADLSQYAGITRYAVVNAEEVNLVRTGLITENGWSWTPDVPVWIADNGILTQTAPTIRRRIGYAIASNKLVLDPYPIVETV